METVFRFRNNSDAQCITECESYQKLKQDIRKKKFKTI